MDNTLEVVVGEALSNLAKGKDTTQMIYDRLSAQRLASYMAAESGALADGHYHIHKDSRKPNPEGIIDIWVIHGAGVKLQYVMENGQLKAPLFLTVLGDYENRKKALTYLEQKAGGKLE